MMPKNVFVWGKFDVLHHGHVELLKEASAFGRLFVILLPDACAGQTLKFAFPQEERRRHLMETGLVEDVFIDSVSNGLVCCDRIAPDIFCLGYDQKTKWEDELAEHLRKKDLPCRFVRLPPHAGGLHSTRIKEKMPCPCGNGKRFRECHGK